MYTRSSDASRRESSIQNGNGIIHMKDLATREQMHQHARLFSHFTIDPGCSIGRHTHSHETEFFYILKGELAFYDNGTEVTLHAGDVAATGDGETHGLENRTDQPAELMALIVLE
ncbi:MAG: cupin domain-containing protein [Oscillibacter sp.]|jgi:quercetin dioxygenase-like cupin family protein|nr:cupin domain-containing protein [Oscillibacter sp.]